MDYKSVARIIGIVLGVVLSFVIWNSHVKSEVDRRIQQERESAAKQLAERTMQLDSERLQSEKILKEQIVTLQADKEKCQIQLEENKKKQELLELSKKDPRKFKDEIDKTFGVKGKSKK